MKLFLAPMEGVVDFILRDTLTRIGGIDQCVTEFLRVTDLLLPNHLFYKFCPELKTGSRTTAGTPVFLQLLGGNPEPMAENAFRAAFLGSAGIDLNFGCPAKVVNRHEGGAALLKNPCRVHDVVKAVRGAVPPAVPVTVKIRLGFDDPGQCIENAKAAEEGGAKFLTVHARTKTDGYRPPAYWEWIPRIREVIKIPIVANGEVSSVEDYWRCREVSGSDDVMIGRGAISNPFLFNQIKASVASRAVSSGVPDSANRIDNWDKIRVMLPQFYKTNEAAVSTDFARARTKQWLRSLALQSETARIVFDELKVVTDATTFAAGIQRLELGPAIFEV